MRDTQLPSAGISVAIPLLGIVGLADFASFWV
jgi:hypothetical protein